MVGLRAEVSEYLSRRASQREEALNLKGLGFRAFRLVRRV